MSTTINQLNDTWVAEGQKVADLNAKLNSAVLNDDFSADEFAELKTQRDNALARRNALKEQLDQARAEAVVQMEDSQKKPLNNKEKDLKAEFIRHYVPSSIQIK
ncbi:hypothetical protein RM023_09070 [Limosilactobacillus reuteri]|uniref:hypothetical protein n=1 Tax=Limosilactobacillus reuteri TaxID=1598 RepID=UPI0039BFDF15